MPPGQVPTQVPLHQLHQHPDVLPLEGHAEELHDVPVPAAPQDADLIQQQVLPRLPHVALEDLDSHLVHLVQNALVHLRSGAVRWCPVLRGYHGEDLNKYGYDIWYVTEMFIYDGIMTATSCTYLKRPFTPAVRTSRLVSCAPRDSQGRSVNSHGV